MPLYRPPSEGANLIVQASIGCSYNECAFCSMYVSKRYRSRPLDEVFADIDAATSEWPETARVFLADGDAMGLPSGDLLRILEKLRHTFPALQRVSAYATPLNLLKKTKDELHALRAGKLSLVYLGIESGSAEVLSRITKGASPKSIETALNKARAADIKVSATVILGLGGRDLAGEHVAATAALVNRAPPTYLSTLQLNLKDSVAGRFVRRFARRGGDFRWQDDAGVLDELAALIAGLAPPRPLIFRSNHASNALALAGTIPKDRDRLLREIAAARRGERPLRPSAARGF